MAKNPRRKSDTEVSEISEATPTDQEVNEVTDTATTEATAAPAQASAPVDHISNLYDAIMAFTSDGNVEALQTAYRAVPVAARGKAQGAAMKQAMGSGVELPAIGEVLDAFSNLPAATKTSRTTKVELDPVVEGGVRLAGAMIAFDTLRKELGDDSYNLADQWYNSGVPDEYRNSVDSVVASVTKGSEVKSGGTRGPRTTFSQSFKDLVDAGIIPAGAVLTASDGITAEVTDDGKIRTTQGEFDAPSAAAKIHTTKDGKDTATNGWAFWHYDGKAIGTLRQS